MQNSHKHRKAAFACCYQYIYGKSIWKCHFELNTVSMAPDNVQLVGNIPGKNFSAAGYSLGSRQQSTAVKLARGDK